MSDIWDRLEQATFRPETVNKPGLMTDMRRGVGALTQGVGSSLRDFSGDRIGQGIEDSGRGLMRRNPGEINSMSDIIDKPLTTVREAVGELVPQLGAMGGGALAGRVVGGAVGSLLGPLGTLAGQQAGGYIGSTAPLWLQSYGSQRVDQREAGIDDKGRAAVAATGSAVLERFTGAERIASKVIGQGTDMLKRGADQVGIKALAAHTGKQALRGGLEEGLTEIPQSGLERWGTYKDLTSAEALDEYGVAGIKGAAGGGVLRGGLGAVAGRREPIVGETDLTQRAQDPDAPRLGLQYSPMAGTPTIFPDGTVTLDGERENQYRTGARDAEGNYVGPTPPISEEAFNEDETQFAEPPPLPQAPAPDPVQQAVQQSAQEHQAKLAETVKRAAQYGIDTKKTAHVSSFEQVADALDENLITAEEAGQQVALIKANRHGEVKSFIKDKRKVTEALATNAETAVAALPPAPAPVAPAPAVKAETLPEAAAALLAPVAPMGAPAPVASAPAAQPVATPAKPTFSVKKSGNSVVLQFGEKTKAVSLKDWTRVQRVLGLDDEGRMSKTPMTYDEAAAAEAVPGKPLAKNARSAVQKSLAKLGLNEKQLDAIRGSSASTESVATPDTQVAEELGFVDAEKQAAEDANPAKQAESEGDLDAGKPMGDMADNELKRGGGMRTTTTNNPNEEALLNDRQLTKAEKEAQAKADEILKAAGSDKKGRGERTAEELDEKAASELAERNAKIAAENKRLDEEREAAEREADLSPAAQRLMADARDEWNKNVDDGELDWGEISAADRLDFMDLYSLYDNGTIGGKEYRERLYDISERANSPDARPRMAASAGPSNSGKTVADSASPRAAGISPPTQSQPAAPVGGNVQGNDQDRNPVPEALAEGLGPVEGWLLKNPVSRIELESHYGMGAQKPEFLPKLMADIQAFLAQGKVAVAPRIRKIIESVAALVPKVEASVAPREGGSNAAVVRAQLQTFMRLDTMGKHVTVVQSVSELPAILKALIPSKELGKIQGLHVEALGRVFLIADNIPQGARSAKSVFLHEVGGHMGIQKILDDGQFEALVDTIMQWSDRKDGSPEHRIAVAALQRVAAAKTAPESYNNELVAYAIEEAVRTGVDPRESSNRGPLATWLRSVYDAFKAAFRKVGGDPYKFTAQDLVDMAYGAARMTLNSDADKVTLAAAKPVKVEFSMAMTGNPTYDGPLNAVGRVLKNFKQKGVTMLATTEHLAEMAEKYIPAVKDYMESVRQGNAIRAQQTRRVEEITSKFAKLNAVERGTEAGSVNAFLKKSTMERKWGFVPDWVPGAVVDPATAAAFNRLSAGAREVIVDVFRHGDSTLKAMQSAVTQNIIEEYDQQIGLATTPKERADLAKAKAKTLGEYQRLMSMNSNWPYAPLKRFGNFAAIGTSQAYADAYARDDQKEMARLKSDENHYWVSFHDTLFEAQSKATELSAKYTGHTSAFDRLSDADRSAMYGDVLGTFHRLKNMDQDVAAATRKMMSDLYMNLLSESSARQSERQRDNVAGADKDMMKSFATQGLASAHFIANLTNNGATQTALAAMKRQANDHKPGHDTDHTARSAFYNEIQRRYAMGLAFDPSPRLDKVLGFTSGWMLLTNPSYYLQNSLQTWLMSLPLLAGKHGYGASNAALIRAYKDVAPILRDGKFADNDFAAVPADVRDGIRKLAGIGRIQMNLEDLGDFGSNPNVLARTGTKLKNVAQTIESLNRLTTAVSAIRLELARGKTMDEAVKYASSVIVDTHGDYSAFNSPRFMRGDAGRLLTQFRKFQIIQASMIIKTFHQAFKGSTPEERWVGKKALMFTLGHMFGTSGMMGLPGFALLAKIVGMAFGDEDEPDNPEATLRRLIGDDDLADLLLKGVPKFLGVDMSNKLGAGNAFSILPYADFSWSRDGYAGLLAGAAGPTIGGLGSKVADGIGLMGEGNYYKGMEQLLPTGLANTAKAYRFATDGVTQRNGDVTMSADEIGLLDAMSQAFGTPTNKITDRNFMASVKYDYETFYNDRTKSLKSAYTAAYKDNDAAAMAEAREDWMRTQAKRKELGFKVQPLSELLKAPVAQKKREKEVVGGVQYRKDSKDFLTSMTER